MSDPETWVNGRVAGRGSISGPFRIIAVVQAGHSVSIFAGHSGHLGRCGVKLVCAPLWNPR
jgi:hypothetical protein